MMKNLLKRWFGGNAPTVAAAAVDVPALYQQAFALHSSGRLDEAQQHYHAVLQHAPQHVAALAMLGTIALQRGDAAAALPWIAQSLAADDHQPEAYCNQGFALAALQRPEEALQSYERAIALNPEFAEAHANRGNVLRDRQRPEEALQSYERAIALKPEFAMAHNSRGTVLKELGERDQALASYTQAIALFPNYAEAHYNKALLLHESLQLEPALAHYDQALALQAGYVDAVWSKALLLILHGHYEEGWKLYEVRRQRPEMQFNYPAYPQPLWLGDEPLAGKTILVYAEQGLGDTIQFCRYLPLLEAQGAQVLLMVHPPLVPLLKTLQGHFRWVRSGDNLPPFDYHCPLLSLPLALQTRSLANIPVTIPYLAVDTVRRLRWQKRLGPRTALRVGLAWSGAAGHLDDRNRSLALTQLQPLLALADENSGAGVEFHSLQKDLREADKVTLNTLSFIHQHSDQLHDFAETAALVEQMDVIVSVDTSVAHLAGALGKPVCIVLPYFPDYRWLLHRSDSPWYPTATLFRQPQRGDWNKVIDEVTHFIQQFKDNKDNKDNK